MTPLDFDLSDPRLDSDAPPAFTCGECDQTRAAARLFEFAAAQLRARVADLEHALGLALELLDAQAACMPAVFSDEASSDVDPFGLLDPPTLVRVLEVVPDPFRGGGVDGASNVAASASCAAEVGPPCGDVVFDGSGYTCTLPTGHAGLHAVIEGGRQTLVWGRSRV